jgi:alanine racemase
MSRSDTPTGRIGAGGVLTIDLDAIAANWKLLAARLAPGSVCGAVVKADAYGLGLAPVSRALHAAGCRTFFVALPDEGLALRGVLPDAEICVFNGVEAAYARDMAAAGLTPVLNHLGQIADWSAAAGAAPLAAMLHVDTGMTRLGLSGTEVSTLAADPGRLKGIRPTGIMSHLACADQPDHAMNADQRARFDATRTQLAGLAPCRASLANSSGVFLGADYHYELVRPGAALYGVAPQPDAPNPMGQVVGLKGKIVQTRRIDTPSSVGYGATHRAERGRLIATVAVGYADGFLRSLSGAASAHVGQTIVRVVGRVSMDLITVDVTDVPEQDVRPGAFVDLIGPRHTIDDAAREAGTIAYEILTALGPRFARHYTGTGA